MALIIPGIFRVRKPLIFISDPLRQRIKDLGTLNVPDQKRARRPAKTPEKVL